MGVAERDCSPPIEWPTMILAAIIYGGWAGLTWYHDRLPTWLVVLAGAWLIAWHGSLQHETIHNAATRIMPHVLAGTRLAA